MGTAGPESGGGQVPIPVTRGNFDNSWGVAGELSGSLTSEVASVLVFSAVAGLVPGAAIEGADVASLAASAPAVLTGIFSVRIMAPSSCAVFIFHQTPPAKAVATTMHTSRINFNGR